MSGGVRLEDLPPKARAEALQQLSGMRKTGDSMRKEAPKSRIRQSGASPNKLEADFASWLGSQFPHIRDLRWNAMRLELANGLRYTPDYTGWLDGALMAWEVKGPHAWDDSIAKLKVAARAWPEINFVLAWRADGIWRNQAVLA